MNGTRLDPNAPAYPCGVIAQSMFNDTYELYRDDPKRNPDSRIKIDSEAISWYSDVELKYRNLPIDDWQAYQWIDVNDRKYQSQITPFL